MEEERRTQFAINILATEVILCGVSDPNAQIHPLQLSLTFLSFLDLEAIPGLTFPVSSVHRMGNTFEMWPEQTCKRECIIT